MEKRIEIEFNKAKIVFLCFVATGFVILGFLFLMNPEALTSPLLQNLTVIQLAGISSILFSGLCSILLIRKLFDNKIRLIIDSNGIIDNSNTSNLGLIEWDDITNTSTIQVSWTKILMIETHQPEKYINRANNKLSKQALKANFNLYGTPISITSSSLKIKHNDLKKLIQEELEKRKINSL